MKLKPLRKNQGLRRLARAWWVLGCFGLACGGRAGLDEQDLASGPTLQAACDHFSLVYADFWGDPSYPIVSSPGGKLGYRHRQVCMQGARYTNITAQMLEACATGMQAWLDSNKTVSYASACAFPKHGLLAEGAACLDSYQCQSGACSHTGQGAGNFWPTDALFFNPGASCGQCLGGALEAEPCGDESHKTCSSGLFCSATEQLCLPFAGENESCAPYDSTDSAHRYCGADLLCVAGTCIKLGTVPAGGVCGSAGVPVSSSACAEGLFCNDKLVCEVYVPGPAGEGDACESSSDCGADLGCNAYGQCSGRQMAMAPGELCDGYLNYCYLGLCPRTQDSSGPWVCPSILQDGAACDPNDASQSCDAYARCRDGKCQFLTMETCAEN
jgi:hypothetical protein